MKVCVVWELEARWTVWPDKTGEECRGPNTRGPVNHAMSFFRKTTRPLFLPLMSSWSSREKKKSSKKIIKHNEVTATLKICLLLSGTMKKRALKYCCGNQRRICFQRRKCLNWTRRVEWEFPSEQRDGERERERQQQGHKGLGDRNYALWMELGRMLCYIAWTFSSGWWQVFKDLPVGTWHD